MSQITRKNDAVFPVTDGYDIPISHGLTKLEYFTAIALQGLMSNTYFGVRLYDQTHLSELAVKQAIAVLDNLSKTE